MNEQISAFISNFAEEHARPNIMVGFADVSGVPDPYIDLLPYTNAISVAIALNPAVVSGIANGPTREYYDEVEAENVFLHELNDALREFLTEKGYGAQTQEELRSKLMELGHNPSDAKALKHRVVAAHAGLGWVGKNALVITKHFGPAIRLTTVFTDAPFACCQEVFLSRCSRCVECIKACPVDAINASEWNTGLSNSDLVDIDACRDACHKQSRESFGIESNLCGLCIYACPYTKSYLRRNGCEYA